jgi:hypothetical protein
MFATRILAVLGNVHVRDVDVGNIVDVRVMDICDVVRDIVIETAAVPGMIGLVRCERHPCNVAVAEVKAESEAKA